MSGTQADDLLREGALPAHPSNVPARVLARPRAAASRSEWPTLGAAAYYGLAGEIVRTIDPHTEADPVAVLVQLLVAVGSWIGAAPHMRVGAERHPPRDYVGLVGATASGRKGTAWAEVRRVLTLVDEWFSKGKDRRVVGGLSSGEGVIHAVRDPVSTQEPIRENGKRGGKVTGEQIVLTDAGVTDKRLLIVEPELATVLARAHRDGNVLSAILRQAWDSGDLSVLIRGGGEGGYRATGAHVSILSHITRDELLRVLDATEQANGFGNRFLWVCTRRSKELPDGGDLEDEALMPLVLRLRRVAEMARCRGRVDRTAAARELWHAVYSGLTAERPGIYGAMVARGAPHVLRIALIYALLDGEAAVDLPHLEAALAVWKYCADSVRWTWGDALGDPTADAVLAAIRQAPAGLTRTEISTALGRHTREGEIARALGVIQAARIARPQSVPTAGRPAERWLLVEPAKEAKEAKEGIGALDHVHPGA